MLAALGPDTGTEHVSGLGAAIREVQKLAEPLQSLVRVHLSTTSAVQSARLQEFYIAVADVVKDEVSETGCAKLKAYSLHIHTSRKLLGCGSFLIFDGGIVRYVRLAWSSGTRTGMVLLIFSKLCPAPRLTLAVYARVACRQLVRLRCWRIWKLL